MLVETRNPLNIGAVARAIANFGFHRLRLVRPYSVAYREARSAVNASGILRDACEYDTLAEAVADCSLVVGTTAGAHRELLHSFYRLETAGRRVRRHLSAEPAALLFGSEKYGLGNDHLSFCHWLVRIGTHPEHASMNLGQAVAVCLYELTRRTPALVPKVRQRAASEQLERFTALTGELLAESGYPAAPSSELKLRRLVRRLRLSAQDADIWTGMLRQIRWKLRQNQ